MHLSALQPATVGFCYGTLHFYSIDIAERSFSELGFSGEEHVYVYTLAYHTSHCAAHTFNKDHACISTWCMTD